MKYNRSRFGSSWAITFLERHLPRWVRGRAVWSFWRLRTNLATFFHIQNQNYMLCLRLSRQRNIPVVKCRESWKLWHAAGSCLELTTCTSSLASVVMEPLPQARLAKLFSSCPTDCRRFGEITFDPWRWRKQLGQAGLWIILVLCICWG